MFFGSFAHNLDDKGRLVIPRKMREEIGVKAFIMKGFDGALSIYKASEFEKLVHEFNTLSFNKRNSRDYLRVQLASVSELEVDKSGRVQIPAQMLTKFQIGKEVMVIGMGDHIEVWNQTDFAKYEKDAISSFEKTAEDLDSVE
ncbi:MAG: division/cell wall cluster transcriptional repressor MraZ [Bacilli bacterium]